MSGVALYAKFQTDMDSEFIAILQRRLSRRYSVYFQREKCGTVKSVFLSLSKNAHIRFLFRNSYFNKIIRLKRMNSLHGIKRNRKFSTLFLKTWGEISTERITALRLFHHFELLPKLQYNSIMSVHISSCPCLNMSSIRWILSQKKN